MIITKSHAEEATARPWRIDHNARVEIKQDTDEWSSMIATVYKSGRCNGNNYRMPALANAQLIVTAVNSYEALQAQNKLLREALEFYANPANLEQFATTGSNDFKGTAWGEIDDGISNVARAALKDGQL